MPTSKLVLLAILGLGAVGVTLSGQIKVPWMEAPAKDGTAAFGKRLGYLSPSELPDVIALLSPPPAPGSEAMKRDEQARQAALTLKGTPRYALAAADAVREHSNTVADFECAFGTGITTQRTPHLYELLSRLRLDVRAATYPAKSHFKRPRPFAVYNVHTCYPDDEATVRNDGSYPSARGAVGWAFALVLAELRPDRADIILKRGRDFGESRIVCDQEWLSDVDAGRAAATVTVGRMEANAGYKADFESARKEVALELAAGVKPAHNCAPEATALASR